MNIVAKQKAGRKYSVEGGGISSLRREYVVVMDEFMPANGEMIAFPGVPAIGSPHPIYENIFVRSYDVEEGKGSDKITLIVTVNYGKQESEQFQGSEAETIDCAVDEWGWDDGVDENELTQGVDGTKVLNSAGDPFDSVPIISVPAPCFTKVMRFKDRQTGWAAHVCCVNSKEISFGGRKFPVGTLLCTVAEKRIFGDDIWKYRYTVHLKLKSNIVKIEGAKESTDIGWDVAVVDAGMREKDAQTGKKKLIRTADKESGTPCVVTSPALLNGNGGQLAADAEPYIFRFMAYKRSDFPEWFYSEPGEVKSKPGEEKEGEQK